MAAKATHEDERAGTMDLLGGRLCLDFVNTADSRGAERVVELLLSYRDLVDWGGHAGALTPEEVARLRAAGERSSDAAAAALGAAIALREALYRVFLAAMDGRAAPPDDLRAVNAALGRALGQARLTPGTDNYAWAWADADRAEQATSGNGGAMAMALDRVLWPVLRSAADLLASADLRRVHACANARCGWLFLDTSRNHSRRWCAMGDCGNRAKAQRHYHRRRATT